jgi:hypothetical protein
MKEDMKRALGVGNQLPVAVVYTIALIILAVFLVWISGLFN